MRFKALGSVKVMTMCVRVPMDARGRVSVCVV